MQVRRGHAQLVLAGYCALALAIPALTPSLPDADTLLPIASLVLARNLEGYARMQPPRQHAGAALHALQASGAQQPADAFWRAGWR